MTYYARCAAWRVMQVRVATWRLLETIFTTS
nr:MAG TPA: hypothetical protein [Caudoviricetes sp.]